MPSTSQQKMAESFRVQAGWSERLNSPLYHALLLRIADDVESSGLCWQVLGAQADSSDLSLPLRFLAAIHRYVLEGQFSRLARFYPSGGGTADAEAAWPALLAELELHGEALSQHIPQTVQTNEVARCC